MAIEPKPCSPHTATSPTPPPPEADPGLKAGFRWFLAGFALLGLCVGYFAGNSRTPVIGVVLPLLFGLVGGAGGFYLSGADLSAPTTSLRLRFLGVALTGFILMVLVGSAYGVLLRTGLGVASFFPSTLFVSGPSRDLPLLGEKKAHEAVQLVLMRARLQALGASEAEQRIILDRIVEDQTGFDVPHDAASTLNRLAALIDQVVAALPSGEGEQPPSEIRQVTLYLDSYSKDLRRFAGRAEAGEQMSSAFLSFIVETVNRDLERRIDRYGLAYYLSEHESFRQRLADLRWALFEETERLRGNPSLSRPQVIQEVDSFLSLFSGRTKATDGALVSAPRLGPSLAD